MIPGFNGRLISTAGLSLLSVNVVVNIYNLFIFWFIGESMTKTLLGHAPDVKQFIISIETNLCILAIYLATTKSIFSTFYTVKFSTYAVTFAMLCVDLTLTCLTALELFSNNGLVKFWKMITNNKNLEIPASLYLIAAVLLAIYFVFKVYVVRAIFYFEKNLRHESLGEEYLIRDENIQPIDRTIPQERIFSLTSPPSYNQCIMDSTRTSSSSPPPSPPPPPYSIV